MKKIYIVSMMALIVALPYTNIKTGFAEDTAAIVQQAGLGIACCSCGLKVGEAIEKKDARILISHRVVPGAFVISLLFYNLLKSNEINHNQVRKAFANVITATVIAALIKLNINK